MSSCSSAISGYFSPRVRPRPYLHVLFSFYVLLLRALKVRSCMCLLTAELIIFVSIGADFNWHFTGSGKNARGKSQINHSFSLIFFYWAQFVFGIFDYFLDNGLGILRYLLFNIFLGVKVTEKWEYCEGENETISKCFWWKWDFVKLVSRSHF